MKEQEQYKKMLKKIINEAENLKIESSEELVSTLVTELAKLNPMVSKTGKTTFQ